MSLNNVLPWWVLTMPSADAPAEEQLKHLETQAEKDGMPEHVRQRLISKYRAKAASEAVEKS